VHRVIKFGLVLIAALGVAGVSAVSVSASASEFYASKTGKTKSKSTDAQVFKTGAGTLECSEVVGSGEMKEGLQATHKEVFTYSGCSAFGSKVKVSSADFLFNADGAVKLENEVTIVPTNEECEVVIPSQTLEKATYENKSGGKVQAEANAFKIHSKPTGGSCGSSENTEGSYNGAALGELEGGTLEWR
jgi:hypothetical protein